MSDPLLAKSARFGPPLSLQQHLVDTEEAAQAIFKPGSRWAQSFCRFFRLGEGEKGRFLLHLRLAGLFHDIGKANDDFQRVVKGRGERQSFRHEHLSALLLSEPSVRKWLASNSAIDVDIVVAAVLSHHLKASENGGRWQVLLGQRATPTALLFDDDGVRRTLGRIAATASLNPFELKVPASQFPHDAWQVAFDALFENGSRLSLSIGHSPERAALLMAVKAGLIAADSVASGLWREDMKLERWVNEVAHRSALTAEEIHREVIERRQAELGPDRWKGWHGFQEGAATVGRRGLLLAACGAGKTLAAWRWAQAVAANEPIGRVVFLYPTRGTATEGFRDYVAHAPEGEAALVHGTAAYELSGMLVNPPESMRGKAFDDESAARLFALGLWPKRYFSATVDQFLGFMEHSYDGLCLLPALADSAVVLDEIHSYDNRMWNALVTFLRRFDIPVLCMTATLPPHRRRELVEGCGLRAYPGNEELAALKDLEDKETCPRYQISPTTREDAVAAACDAFKRGARVLWVVNTVARCQETARELRDRLSVPVGVYHSRFRLQDRQARHRATVDAFQGPLHGLHPAAIAVTTQVCEMSLDLDADVLVTEHAPISSLVQRFGRANRHLRRGRDFRAQLLTYQPAEHLPYEKDELVAAAAFLAELGTGDVSQRDLAQGLEKHALAGLYARGSTAFVSGGYYAVTGSLRDADDSGVAAILDNDVEAYAALRLAGKPTDGLIINVPRGSAPRDGEGSSWPFWLKIADGKRYDPWLGFLMNKG